MPHQLNAPSQDVCSPEVFRGLLLRLRQQPEGVWHHQPAVQLSVWDVILDVLEKSSPRRIKAQDYTNNISLAKDSSIKGVKQSWAGWWEMTISELSLGLHIRVIARRVPDRPASHSTRIRWSLNAAISCDPASPIQIKRMPWPNLLSQYQWHLAPILWTVFKLVFTSLWIQVFFQVP